MTAFVVDTNVAIVASRRGTHADERCQLACVEKLESVVAQEGTSINTTPATFGKTEARVGDEVTRGREGAIL